MTQLKFSTLKQTKNRRFIIIINETVLFRDNCVFTLKLRVFHVLSRHLFKK